MRWAAACSRPPKSQLGLQSDRDPQFPPSQEAREGIEPATWKHHSSVSSPRMTSDEMTSVHLLTGCLIKQGHPPRTCTHAGKQEVQTANNLSEKDG